MVDVLDEIVARKRIDVTERLQGIGLDTLRGQARPTRRSLRAALARAGGRFIMEVKRGSPSQGLLRAGVDPAAQARAYGGAADAISVLTDGPYFGGSFADLRAVRQVFDGPILAKDFIVDPRQVPEARMHGADAVLVMLSVLSDAQAACVMDEARRLDMDALVEAHDEREVRRAVRLGAPIIGINNRDLRTLSVDLRVTERLAGLVPADRLVVAESGIQDRSDVERLSRHADAFLVGSSLMRAGDPRGAARALAFGRVKVCGLTDPHDVETAAECGAAYAGLIMVPHTPRAVTPAQAGKIAETAAGQDLPLVGVFRDEAVLKVVDAVRELRLHAVQLHGQESAAYISDLKLRLPERCEIWATGAVGTRVPAARPGADRTLFDTLVGGRSGGTGRTFDWQRIRRRPELKRAILAGGLNPANACRASRVGAFALDVGSGVEMAPGRKDAGKLHAFFQALRPAKRGEVLPC